MADRLASLPLTALVFAGALLLAAAPSCLERWDGDSGSPGGEACASCHGDPSRAGDALVRSAPPRDLSGASEPSYPGVGAHLIHLQATATHGPIPCAECHVVPDRTDAPGHADDPPPAELAFGALASSGGREPAYDAVARRCSDGYCHGQAAAVWTEPRDSAEACGSCHGLPPPAPHPQSERCDTCHGEVIGQDRGFLQPALHVNGNVEVGDGACNACHGSGDDPAPPRDLAGNTRRTALGVGAHQVHLTGGGFGRPLACAECHHVPETADDPEHADGLPADVLFTGPAVAGAHAPLWDREQARCSDTYCHAPSSTSGEALSPSWVEPGALGCTSCHGLPPPAPHPQLEDCSQCHADVVGADDRTIIDVTRHVDGNVDFEFDQACNACHGGDNAAPPRSLAGDEATSAPGVGAHQAHVLGSDRARAVPCADCHTFPSGVLDEGHLDSPPPAELVFSGAAVAFDATPVYENGVCANTPCHGAVFPKGNDSGGSLTVPEWTRVDGSQAACGSCHGLPPPAPHPYYTPNCGGCHENIGSDNETFLRPDLHVDGVVTFTLP